MYNSHTETKHGIATKQTHRAYKADRKLDTPSRSKVVARFTLEGEKGTVHSDGYIKWMGMVCQVKCCIGALAEAVKNAKPV